MYSTRLIHFVQQTTGNIGKRMRRIYEEVGERNTDKLCRREKVPSTAG